MTPVVGELLAAESEPVAEPPCDVPADVCRGTPPTVTSSSVSVSKTPSPPGSRPEASNRDATPESRMPNRTTTPAVAGVGASMNETDSGTVPSAPRWKYASVSRTCRSISSRAASAVAERVSFCHANVRFTASVWGAW